MVIGDTTLSVYLTLKHKDRFHWNTGDFKQRCKVSSTLSNIFFKIHNEYEGSVASSNAT